MPKVPPDQVIRHEIVLGKAERELVRNTLEAYQFKSYSTPIVAGLSDVTFTATVAALLGLTIGRILDDVGLDPNWRDIISAMTPEEVKDWLETQNIVLGGIGAFLGFFVGGPLGAAAGGVLGGAVAEGGEYVIEEANKSATVQRFIDWWLTLNLPDWANP